MQTQGFLNTGIAGFTVSPASGPCWR